MSTTIGVVDLPPAPGGDGSVQRALAGRRFAGSTLLQWVAQRLTEVETLDQTVILLSGPHAGLKELVPPNISVHISQESDPLAQLADVCQAYAADAVVRVSVDAPFFDPVLVDQLICTANEAGCDYVTYCDCNGKSAIQSRLGLVGEWIGAEALKRARSEKKGQDPSSPSLPIWSRPETYQLRFIPVPEPLDRQHLRLMIDSEEDWDHAHQIYEALGPDEIDWRHISVLLGMHREGKTTATVNEEAS